MKKSVFNSRLARIALIATSALFGQAQAQQSYTPVNLDSDILFDFDSDKLTQNARQGLLAKINTLRPYAPKIALLEVVGHTDAFGNSTYNYQLGLNRAIAVQRLVVDMLDLPDGTMVGYSQGENDSITHCPADMPKPKLIDCLAKDRRVTLKVHFN